MICVFSIELLGMFCCTRWRVNIFASVSVEFSVNFLLLNQSVNSYMQVRTCVMGVYKSM